MKYTLKDGGMSLVVENPDERMTQEIYTRLGERIEQEIKEFFQEVQVALRKLDDDEPVILKSRPIEVEISRVVATEETDLSPA